MTLYQGAALRNDVGGAEILARCLVRDWEPIRAEDETCRVCGHKHIELCYEIYDPITGLVVYPVGSECIFTFTGNTPADRKVARKQKRDAEVARNLALRRERDAENARILAEFARKAEERRRAQRAPLPHQTCMSCTHTFCKFYHDPTSAHADRFCWKGRLHS